MRYEAIRRDATTVSLQSVPSSTPEAEAAELMETVTSIQEGLSDLPQDVFEFLKAIDDRLHAQEALLASLLAVFTTATGTASPSTTLSIANATSTGMLVPSSTSVLVSISVTAEAPSSSTNVKASSSATVETYSSLTTATACRRGGAGPLVPCSSYLDQTSSSSLVATSSTPRSRVTRTLTRTTYLPVPVTTFVQSIPFSSTTGSDLATRETSSSSSIPVLPVPSIYFPPDTNSSSINATTTPTPAESQAVEPYNSVPSPTSTNYIFKTSRQNNVAAYYGQTPDTKAGDLLQLCQNSNVDIVVLAFVTSFFTNGGLPSANFGPGCKGSTTAQQLHAPGLQDCTDLAPEIVSCQQLGKPVLVSLGGYYSNVTFASDTEAIQLAQNLWDLFGAGDGLDASLRPFGSIVIDGFDLDNESKDPSSYTTFAQTLRTLFSSDKKKHYYLSAAPQCPRPDASIPVLAMALCDFIFVQFYNNPSCELSSSGFAGSFAAWSDELFAANNQTKLYIGVGASEKAGSGYVDGAGLGHQVNLARQLYTSNLGGVMLWDGVEGLENVDEYGNDYLVYAKGSLE
ncbi:glycoside hydrolase [Aureobasidium sp. EXF-3400]|nr:glycoside hydrolase [Aureobasidium sp. EXF-12344]KAI4772078.1 glycoside hydrolase [Aureobasidium sp. EXF-3400]